MNTPSRDEGGVLMRYNLANFKQDIRIGSMRAFRDLFSPATALYRVMLKIGTEAAERNIREAQLQRTPLDD